MVPGGGDGVPSHLLCLESCGPFDTRAQWEPHLSLASLGALTLSKEDREWQGEGAGVAGLIRAGLQGFNLPWC